MTDFEMKTDEGMKSKTISIFIIQRDKKKHEKNKVYADVIKTVLNPFMYSFMQRIVLFHIYIK